MIFNRAADVAALAAPYSLNKTSTPIADGGKVQRIHFSCWDDILLLKQYRMQRLGNTNVESWKCGNRSRCSCKRLQDSGSRKERTVVNPDSNDYTCIQKERNRKLEKIWNNG